MIGHNIHPPTVEGFGDEWERFDQSKLPPEELQKLFNAYFSIFPWEILSQYAVGFDLGCGSGRWAKLVAPRVGRLHCIDPSSAIEIAKANLAANENCIFHKASADSIPLDNSSMDFGYSLGVLHHVPDTAAALSACVEKLKPGAPILVYLYYAFDNRPRWFRGVWQCSELLRYVISRLPKRLRYVVSQIIAGLVYFPLSRLSSFLETININVSHIPLSAYRDKSFYTMRTDALDRFGTRLEQRFTRDQIHAMMLGAGLERIAFSPSVPFWCAVGYRKETI